MSTKTTTQPSSSAELAINLTYLEESLQMVKDGEADAATALPLLRQDFATTLRSYAEGLDNRATQAGIRHYAELVLDPATDLGALADRFYGWGTDAYEGPRDFYVRTDLDAAAPAFKDLASLTAST